MRWLAFLLGLALATATQADILYLRDGSRYYGTLIRQTDSAVVFRVAADGSGSGVVRRFAASEVRAVRHSAISTPPGNPLQTRPAVSAGDHDYEQMVREAYELLDDGDAQAALLALQRVVTEAPPAMLDLLDRKVRHDRGRPLADLLAETRMRLALHSPRGELFDLRSVTRYESGALGQLLQAHADKLLARVYRGRSIADWAAKPERYDKLDRDARHLVHDARLAAAMLTARLKYDRSLRPHRDLRARLAATRTALARLAGHVRTMPGYTALPPPTASAEQARRDDPTAAVAARIIAERASAATQPATSQSATTQPAIRQPADSQSRTRPPADGTAEPRP